MTGVQTCALPICFPVTIRRPGALLIGDSLGWFGSLSDGGSFVSYGYLGLDDSLPVYGSLKGFGSFVYFGSLSLADSLQYLVLFDTVTHFVALVLSCPLVRSAPMVLSDVLTRSGGLDLS